MIAQTAWFTRRKYGGWGVTPATREGWIYLAVLGGILLVLQLLPIWSEMQRMYITVGWATFLLLDLIPVMIRVKRDELEWKIEAIAERNAAWTMSLLLVLGIVYESISSALRDEYQINWIIVVALLGGVLAKSLTNLILERAGIDNDK